MMRWSVPVPMRQRPERLPLRGAGGYDRPWHGGRTPHTGADPLSGLGLQPRRLMSGLKRVVVLGSTGSIGTNTLDVIRHLDDRLQAVGLSAHASWEALFDQAAQHHPRWVVLTDPEAVRTADRS